MNTITKKYDLVVVGGGTAGVSAAIAAARHGVQTALVQNRSVLGGNASSELRVHINGAARDGGFKNAIESGIILELLLANKKVNPQYSYHVFDQILWEKTNFQENLDLYLETCMNTVQMDGNKIKSITAYQATTETTFVFEGDLFADTTGDATLSALSGADWTIGREARDTYNESLAPEVADKHTMGSTILFSMQDMGKPVPFKRPDWAYEYTKEMLGSRKIPELTHGYWWIEVGGDEDPIIESGEFIREELMKYVYGVFDYIKNSGEYEADYLAIDWISTLPGKRESRRVYGDYVLNQNDIDEAKRFEDAVAYGGWTMDAHTVGGIKATGAKEQGTHWYPVHDIYTIPYRCLYSRNIENLYVGGRAMSASHMAMSSTRVMGTGAVVGQAIGTAASIAKQEKTTPRGVGKYISRLQQTLIKDDCYIPGIKAVDEKDLVSQLDCQITASSYQEGAEPTEINNDYARRVDTHQNGWISQEIGDMPEWLRIQMPQQVSLKEVLLRFDPNFSGTLIPTQSSGKKKAQPEGMPYELVKDYTLSFKKEGVLVKEIPVKENFQRVNHYHLEETIVCDEVSVSVEATYGDDYARVFDVRLYE